MELFREFDFCFNSCILVIKSHLREHNAHLVEACIDSFVLVLNVWVHVSEKQLLVVFICKLELDALGRRFYLRSELIVCSDNAIEDLRVQNLDFHFQSLTRVKLNNANNLRNLKQLCPRSISIHWAQHRST